MTTYKKTDYEKSHAKPIQILPNVHEWLIDKNKHSPTYMHDLYANHKDKLKDKWGTQAFCLNGSGNTRYWVWVKVLDNSVMWILTSPSRGTLYEVSYEGKPSNKMQTEVIKFINKFNNDFIKI